MKAAKIHRQKSVASMFTWVSGIRETDGVSLYMVN